MRDQGLDLEFKRSGPRRAMVLSPCKLFKLPHPGSLVPNIVLLA